MSSGTIAEATDAMAASNVEDNEETQRVRKAGWAEPQKYDYDTFNAPNPSREERAAAEEEGKPPAWAANAQKYEWKDDYGDVGPRHAALEEMLFNDENITRVGLAFDKWVCYHLPVNFS